MKIYIKKLRLIYYKIKELEENEKNSKKVKKDVDFINKKVYI